MPDLCEPLQPVMINLTTWSQKFTGHALSAQMFQDRCQPYQSKDFTTAHRKVRHLRAPFACLLRSIVRLHMEWSVRSILAGFLQLRQPLFSHSNGLWYDIKIAPGIWKRRLAMARLTRQPPSMRISRFSARIKPRVVSPVPAARFNSSYRY